MTDKPKPVKKARRIRIADLSPGEVRVLEDRLGVVLTPGQEPLAEPEEAEEICAFCGRTQGKFRHLFDAHHNITICLRCLESTEDE